MTTQQKRALTIEIKQLKAYIAELESCVHDTTGFFWYHGNYTSVIYIQRQKDLLASLTKKRMNANN